MLNESEITFKTCAVAQAPLRRRHQTKKTTKSRDMKGRGPLFFSCRLRFQLKNAKEGCRVRDLSLRQQAKRMWHGKNNDHFFLCSSCFARKKNLFRF
ncbi:hypothetical protein CEXT_590761 [Caerostris extrusa]|uniref:Uncharacterized protein n=1 Tax=Caerostris extrusa TaxID=172846 RepID=A0AAV4XF52_CAEEX|nr:hypothetical protein CEXT_590761 [Caerostris extrusa]